MRHCTLALWAWMVASSIGNRGFAQDANCLNRLRPCLYYLNDGRNDHHSTCWCCDSLKAVIKTNPVCLCEMMSNRGASAAERAGINITEAQELPGKCGQNIDPLACISGSGSSRDSVRNAADSRRNCSIGMPALFIAVILLMKFL